jgi:hypothetical protein
MAQPKNLAPNLWIVDRVIVTHGDVLESGGKAKFAAAFSYL